DSVSRYTPTQAALVLAATQLAAFSNEARFRLDELNTSTFVQKIYRHVPDYPDDYFFHLSGNADDDDDWSEEEEKEDQKRPVSERFQYDIDRLDGDVIEIVQDMQFRVSIDLLRPIQATLLDAHLRYGLDDSELLSHVFAELEVLAPFGLRLI